MEPTAIIHELTHSKRLPREALKAAAERRAELAPILINEIEAYLSLPADQRAASTPVFYAFHLLGDWKDKSAYRPLSRLLRCPPHELDVQIGDGLVETAHKVMASVFDGDPGPIFEIILDPMAEEFVRARMCEALAMLVLRGEADREAVARFLRDCFMNLSPQSECYVWVGWQSAITMLGLRDLKNLVKKAFDRGFIDPDNLDFEEFIEDLNLGASRAGQLEPGGGEYSLFGNIIDELSGWYCFSDEYERGMNKRNNTLWPSEAQTFTNAFKNVGRNDPCPCGSGKKFKKCCLQ
jgi:hypothetical protein